MKKDMGKGRCSLRVLQADCWGIARDLQAVGQQPSSVPGFSGESLKDGGWDFSRPARFAWFRADPSLTKLLAADLTEKEKAKSAELKDQGATQRKLGATPHPDNFKYLADFGKDLLGGVAFVEEMLPEPFG